MFQSEVHTFLTRSSHDPVFYVLQKDSVTNVVNSIFAESLVCI